MASIDDIGIQRRPPNRIPSIPHEEKAEDGGDTCRICRGEGTPEQPLYYPCKCSGSIKFVHQDCLMEWLSHSQKKYCELCKTPFRFTKLYDESMPEAVPWPLFMRQLLFHSFRAVSRWLRYSLAISIWLCWLPWTIRQIWRGLFWIADGSWLTTQEMQDAASEVFAVHMANTSSASTASAMSTLSANFTIGTVDATISILVPTLSAVLGLLDPKVFLRAILRLLVSVAVNPIATVEPMGWSGGALLSAPISRPPSLLSDFQSIASATRSPILNNAFIDILEGQLVCLAIITAFILVFLIREWVINQQPLLNLPDPDPAENAVPARNDEPRRAVRRRRRHRQLPGGNVEQDDRLALPLHPQIRRAATENNILVQNHDLEENRPEAPRRAASLVPALQELEENARLIGDFPGPAMATDNVRAGPLESPPLQRGVFDDVGYIRRAIEEREGGSSSHALFDTEREAVHETINREPPVPVLPEGRGDETILSSDLPEPPLSHIEPDMAQTSYVDETVSAADEGWISDSETEVIPTPPTPSDLEQDHGLPETSNVRPMRASEQSQALDIDTQSEEVATHSGNDLQIVQEEPQTLWNRISDWLWDTDGHVDGDDSTIVADGSDPVVNIDGDDLLNHAHGHHAGLPVLAPPQPDNPAPNIQNGININNQDAVDDAEDLEGIMELLGMEGPIAGMVQNIIFSVFLITLTLSASIWCPYIWGKITLLFVAHPFSVFIRAPLFLLSRTADVIVDVGLFFFAVIGVLLNQVTKLIKISLSLLAPSWSKYVNPDVLDKLSISLFQKSGSRLEKTFMKAVLGFRPDLPTFSVQAHHVLRVFTKAGTDLFNKLISDVTSHGFTAKPTLSWQGLFTAPVHLGFSLKRLPNICLATFTDLKAWHAQLQEDLRPLSFSNPNEIDYSLVHWSSKEKIFCIALGYALFGAVGYMYLKIAPYIYGLKKDEKITGFFADTLRQAGGVMKVIVIIGIEMIVFPLYCGTMLDFALLPIFEGATVQSRLRFFASAPLTALFVHWFIGTCYMFHFALFVSMCRKIMRKGVLYFIRDPDDPTFHPVRDVLERPVATQLGKIAFSAFVYGSLLVICLGGVIAGLDRVGGILPLRWGISDVPILMPGDIVFFNFILPFILRKVDVSEKLSTVFEWWFRACAGGLRLSDFMFGVDDEREKAPAPFLWRQFFNRMFGAEEKSIEEAPGPIKDLKQLAKNPERLLLIQNGEPESIEVQLRGVAGEDITFKTIHQFQLEGEPQALVEFEDIATALSVKEGINEKAKEPGQTQLRAKAIDEIKIDIRHARDTQVDIAAGTYVRAPAKDSVRIPKGTRVFVDVNEKNERLDGSQDLDDGLHGKKNESFSRIYVPNHFKARILTFVAMVWGFVALAGLSITVGPLLLGRYMVTAFVKSEARVNDLYAFTVGFHALGATAYIIHTISRRWHFIVETFHRLLGNTRQVLPWVTETVKRVAALFYLSLVLGIALPLGLSLIAELYINIPILAYLLTIEDPVKSASQPSHLSAPVAGFPSTPIINLIQTWTLGLLYLRFVIRILKTVPQENSRPAIAIRRIVRHGLLHPDVALATRALVIPVLVACIVLIGLPPVFARAILLLYPRSVSEDVQVYAYRYTYPAVLSVALQVYALFRLRQKIDNWRIKIRDEVYLIGERLHNFPIQEDNKKALRKRTRKTSATERDKGKGKAKTTTMSTRSTQTDQYVDIDSEIPSDLVIPRSEFINARSSASDQPSNTIHDEHSAAVPEHDDDNQTPLFGSIEMRRVLSTTSDNSDTDEENTPPLQTSEQEDQKGVEIVLVPEQRPVTQDQETDNRPGSTLETELDEFREVTGLHSLPEVEDLGDVGRQVYGAGMHGGGEE